MKTNKNKSRMSVYFVETEPPVPSYHDMFMLEGMTYKVVLLIRPEGAHLLDQIQVQVWTNQCDKDCPGHEWHHIPLPHTSSRGDRHTFAATVVITSDKDFSFTYRYGAGDDDWTWSGEFGRDGFAKVNSPRDDDKWTQGPDWNHITGRVHLGNFIAATNAPSCGFTHVLNVADNRDMVYPDNVVTYKKVPMMDGGHNPIPEERIAEAVDWLKQHDRGEGTKILVNCRAGIGRAGSTVVAYVFATNSHMSYEDARKFVYAKRFVYPHVGLKKILYNLYPRQS